MIVFDKCFFNDKHRENSVDENIYGLRLNVYMVNIILLSMVELAEQTLMPTDQLTVPAVSNVY